MRKGVGRGSRTWEGNWGGAIAYLGGGGGVAVANAIPSSSLSGVLIVEQKNTEFGTD